MQFVREAIRIRRRMADNQESILTFSMDAGRVRKGRDSRRIDTSFIPRNTILAQGESE